VPPSGEFDCFRCCSECYRLFRLDGELEQELVRHMKLAELGDDGKTEWPLHKKVHLQTLGISMTGGIQTAKLR
jgi:hypothetical protein